MLRISIARYIDIRIQNYSSDGTVYAYTYVVSTVSLFTDAIHNLTHLSSDHRTFGCLRICVYDRNKWLVNKYMLADGLPSTYSFTLSCVAKDTRTTPFWSRSQCLQWSPHVYRNRNGNAIKLRAWRVPCGRSVDMSRSNGSPRANQTVDS